LVPAAPCAGPAVSRKTPAATASLKNPSHLIPQNFCWKAVKQNQAFPEKPCG
jgi:hypothetical protein